MSDCGPLLAPKFWGILYFDILEFHQKSLTDPDFKTLWTVIVSASFYTKIGLRKYIIKKQKFRAWFLVS